MVSAKIDGFLAARLRELSEGTREEVRSAAARGVPVLVRVPGEVAEAPVIGEGIK